MRVRSCARRRRTCSAKRSGFGRELACKPARRFRPRTSGSREVMEGLSWCNLQTGQGASWDDVRQNVSAAVRSLLEKVLVSLDGCVLSREEAYRLAHTSGDDLLGMAAAADEIRRRLVGEVISYVVTRNINFTNVCFVGCKFCAFSVGSRPDCILSHPRAGRREIAPSRIVGSNGSLHSGWPSA